MAWSVDSCVMCTAGYMVVEQWFRNLRRTKSTGGPRSDAAGGCNTALDMLKCGDLEY